MENQKILKKKISAFNEVSERKKRRQEKRMLKVQKNLQLQAELEEEESEVSRTA